MPTSFSASLHLFLWKELHLNPFNRELSLSSPFFLEDIDDEDRFLGKKRWRWIKFPCIYIYHFFPRNIYNPYLFITSNILLAIIIPIAYYYLICIQNFFGIIFNQKTYIANKETPAINMSPSIRPSCHESFEPLGSILNTEHIFLMKFFQQFWSKSL